MQFGKSEYDRKCFSSGQHSCMTYAVLVLCEKYSKYENHSINLYAQKLNLLMRKIFVLLCAKNIQPLTIALLLAKSVVSFEKKSYLSNQHFIHLTFVMRGFFFSLGEQLSHLKHV